MGFDARSHTGLYQNKSFGFEVIVPRGLRCTGASPPAPAHGCRIQLATKTNSEIWIDAQFDANGNRDPTEEMIRGELNKLSPIVLSSQRVAHPVPGAVEVKLAYFEASGIAMERVVFIFKRILKDGLSVDYVLYLDSPKIGIESYLQIFTKFVASFRFSELSAG